MSNFRYHKGRPFLIINQIYDSNKKQHSESIELVDSVQNKHLTNASIIIDIFPRKTIKNRFSDQYSDDQIIKIYFEKYSDEIAESINVWTKKIGQNKEKAEKLIKALEQQLTIDENDL